MNKCLDRWLHSLECFPRAQFCILTVKNQLSAFDERIITRTNNCYPCKPEHFHRLYSDKRYKSAPRPLISAISSWLFSCVWSSGGTRAALAASQALGEFNKINPKGRAEPGASRGSDFGDAALELPQHIHVVCLIT